MNEMNRRGFLRGALATSALLMATRSLAAPTSRRRFAAVKVSRARLIREVVGLRPYRPQGFVVDATRIGKKLLVHNYGHGGAGITLSWGAAALALDLARDFLSTTGSVGRGSRGRNPTQTSRRFAVVGCGVIGLATARLLQRRFQGSVTIYAKDLPPETTSNIAGGFWYPVSVFDPQQTTTRFADQFRRACQISNRSFQTQVGADYGISWMDTYSLSHNEASLKADFPGGAELYPQIETHRDPEHYFGFPYVRQFSTMIIEPHVYLNSMLRDFFIAGGKVVVKEFRSREEIVRLPESVIFNCSGLGARALFDDQELIPVRGQLEVLLPQPEIDYCYLSGRGYMFPRRDGIILGGTWDHDDWSLAPNPEQTARILEGHTEIMKGLAG